MSAENAITRNTLFEFPDAVTRDPAVEAWFGVRSDVLGAIAMEWFDVMRGCGDDVRELLHDAHPTACRGEAAFGYVNAFTTHVNVGFFRGAEIADPKGLLQGTGKLMRHVTLIPGAGIDRTSLMTLIKAADDDMGLRIQTGRP